MSRIAATLLRSLVALVIRRFLASRAVIDFLEKLVILFDQRVVRFDLERFLVRDARLFEVAFVLVGNRKIVERLGILRVDLHRALPAVDGFTPETALRDGDAEFDLFLRVRPRVGRQRRRRGSEKQQEGHDAGTHGWKCLNIRQPAPPRSVKRRVAGRRTKVRLSKAYATEVRRKTSNSTANYFVRRPLVSRPVHCFATRLSQLRVNGRVIIPSRSGARALSSRSAMSPDEAVALSF